MIALVNTILNTQILLNLLVITYNLLKFMSTNKLIKTLINSEQSIIPNFNI